jgi:RNA polymerase sigma-70 factor (sigma-E family)
VSHESERRAGESAPSFEAYAAARQAGLIRFGYLLVHDHQLAQDLAQEGLARLHSRWAELSAGGNPDAYVRKVMVNQMLSWRRRRSWSERPVADFGDAAATDPTNSIGDREAMWKLIGDLPLRQRAVVVLRYYEDLDDAAIGRILGCAASTVATHATRALDRLRVVVELADAVSPGTS